MSSYTIGDCRRSHQTQHLRSQSKGLSRGSVHPFDNRIAAFIRVSRDPRLRSDGHGGSRDRAAYGARHVLGHNNIIWGKGRQG